MSRDRHGTHVVTIARLVVARTRQVLGTYPCSGQADAVAKQLRQVGLIANVIKRRPR
jgi:hypothetical protein